MTMNTTVGGDHDGVLMDGLRRLALSAGDAAMRLYGTDVEVQSKNDASPVTQADRLGEEIILQGLAEIAPETPTLAEEAASAGRIPELGSVFFLVDPLDGTKEFINQTGEFTVNIALVRDRAPSLGVVYAPALGKLYAGRVGVGATLERVGETVEAPRPIAARRAPDDGLVAMASRSHRTAETDAFLKTLNVKDFAAAGSSLKFCLIAEGLADVYPRHGRTMEWDTAAGHAVLAAAGGRVVEGDGGAPLAYGKESRGYDNPHFIAWGAV